MTGRPGSLPAVPRDDDDAWRAIVDNYGDRVELDPDPAPEPADLAGSDEASRDDVLDPRGDPRTWDPSPADAADPDLGRDPDDRFVPPAPPPVPTTTPDRYAAWAGVFGAPVLLLVVIVLGIELPAILGYALIAAFVGGFVYLVARMPREPRDPGDDGARI